MSMLAYLPKWWIGFITNTVFIIVTVLGYIGIKTFVPQKPPIVPIASDYSVAIGDDSYIVYYKCSSIVNEEFEAHTHRTITHQATGESLSLPATEVKFDVGNASVTRLFYVPKIIPSGKWCAVATVEWRPFMSLVDHRSVNGPKCFEIPAK